MSHAEPAFSLASFLHELLLAWQKLALYQKGHPARAQAVDRAHAVLVRLIAPTGSLALGVSRDALIGPEEKVASASASRLAKALYRREVAVLRFEEGIETAELEQLLRLLPRGTADRTYESLEKELAASGVRHVHAEAVDFSGLVAPEESAAEAEPARGEESLWDRVLQRLLNDERTAVDSSSLSMAGEGTIGEVMAVIDSLLDRYSSAAGEAPASRAPLAPAEALAFLAGIVGGAAGEKLMESSGPEVERSVVRHFTQLLGALPNELQEGVLDAALRELATTDETAPMLQSLGGALSAARLIGSLRRLRAERVALSPRVLSLVESLGVEARLSTPKEGPDGAPDALARELREVFASTDVDRAGMGDGPDVRIFLEIQHHVPSHARFADLEPYLETLDEQRLRVALATTLVDLLQRPVFDAEQTAWVIGRTQMAFRELLAEGRFVSAVKIVEALRAIADSPERTSALRETAESCLDSLAGSDSLAELVDAFRALQPSALDSIRRLVGLLGPRAPERLIDALGAETELARRRHIFDLLVALGDLIVPAAEALVTDSRWYMRRNMLSLLHRVGGISIDIVRSGIEHADPRVRLEAVKCLPEVADQVPEELIRSAIQDADPKVSAAAIGAAGATRMAAAREPLVELLRRPDPFARHKQLRVRALEALGELGDPAVLPRIAHCFRTWFAVVSSEELHTAYEMLRLYPETARRPWLRKGRRAPDATVREICRRLAGDSGNGENKGESR